MWGMTVLSEQQKRKQHDVTLPQNSSGKRLRWIGGCTKWLKQWRLQITSCPPHLDRINYTFFKKTYKWGRIQATVDRDREGQHLEEVGLQQRDYLFSAMPAAWWQCWSVCPPLLSWHSEQLLNGLSFSEMSSEWHFNLSSGLVYDSGLGLGSIKVVQYTRVLRSLNGMIFNTIINTDAPLSIKLILRCCIVVHSLQHQGSVTARRCR